MQSNFSTLCRGHIIPKELDRETTTKFLEACEQFERIMNDSGLVRLRRLSTDEIVGTEGKTGLIERYFSLMPEGDTTLQDIELSAREMRIGDNRLCLHTLSDAEDLPGKVATDTRYEKLSTDRSDCRLSFASPVGLLLSCNHIYNQYVLIDNSEETLQKFEKSARNMQSLSRYSRSNSINREWIDQYLNEAHSYGLTSVRAHFNVMAWSDDAEEVKHIKNDVGSQSVLFGAGFMPGRDSFYALLRQHRLLLPARKTRHTTNSNHRYHKWKNLIKMCIRDRGTRSGDIDAGAVSFIMEKEGLDANGISRCV